jgi:hypothetical protein
MARKLRSWLPKNGNGRGGKHGGGWLDGYYLLKAVAHIILPVKLSFVVLEGTRIVRVRNRPSWVTLKANSYKR